MLCSPGFGLVLESTPLSRSITFSLELAVVAAETGLRGRELRSGGESLGGGVAIYALSLVLPLGVMAPGRFMRFGVGTLVGVLALVVFVALTNFSWALGRL